MKYEIFVNKIVEKHKLFSFTITKTFPCKVYPLEPQFYIAKLGYAGVYLVFSSPEPLGSQGELIGWP